MQAILTSVGTGIIRSSRIPSPMKKYIEISMFHSLILFKHKHFIYIWR